MSDSPFKSKGGLGRLFNALRYSGQGLAAALRHEAAFRQELALAVVLGSVARDAFGFGRGAGLGADPVRVGASGRCGRLEVRLLVTLMNGRGPGMTALSYEADATVSGFVSRLGQATLTVAGSHFTNCFFRDLDRSLRGGVPVRQLAPLT